MDCFDSYIPYKTLLFLYIRLSGDFIYFAIFFLSPKILPPNAIVLPEILFAGNIILPLNLSIVLESLTIVSPEFWRYFNLYPSSVACLVKWFF